MNRLIKFSLTKKSFFLPVIAKRNIIFTSIARYANNNSNDSVGKEMTQEEIDRIKKHEDSYFTNVKNSFDSLQKSRLNESLEEKRSRLMYQSRKRGITENGLLLSHFSAQFLPKMTENELNEYDKIINNVHNEWDLYYWLTNAVEVPEELRSNKVLETMKKFCSNETNQKRMIQPNLPPITN
jgi:succinate dehydrogenase assembly factor 2